MRTRSAVAWVLATAALAASSSAEAQSRGHGRHGSQASARHAAPTRAPNPPPFHPVTVPQNPGPLGPVGFAAYPSVPIFGYGPSFGSGWSPVGGAVPPPIDPWTLFTGGYAPAADFTQPTFAEFEPPAPNRPAAPRPARRDGNRSKEFATLGDRLFRAGNLARSVERYEQAIRADPDSAAPRARLAQVALVRGKYADSAQKLREAEAAQPGWLATAGDVQALYPEPADFARHVARLEAHLQAHPEDRDGWLVLGSLWYLSGRTQKAADVFLRLSDRREDPTLKAFLAASKAE